MRKAKGTVGIGVGSGVVIALLLAAHFVGLRSNSGWQPDEGSAVIENASSNAAIRGESSDAEEVRDSIDMEPAALSVTGVRSSEGESYRDKVAALHQSAQRRELKRGSAHIPVGAFRVIGSAAGAEVNRAVIEGYLGLISSSGLLRDSESAEIRRSLETRLGEANGGVLVVSMLQESLEEVLGESRASALLAELEHRQSQRQTRQAREQLRNLEELELSEAQKIELVRVLQSLETSSNVGDSIEKRNRERRGRFLEEAKRVLSPEQFQQLVKKVEPRKEAVRSLLF